MRIQSSFRRKFRNNAKSIIILAGLLLIFGFGDLETPVMNYAVSSAPMPLRISSLTSSPCTSNGYYADATSCQVGTGSACAVLFLTKNGVSYACYSAATVAPASSPGPTASPTPKTSKNTTALRT